MSLQVLVTGVISGAMIGLGAIGITLTYSILRFANFAHGEFISWGAYIALAVAGALGYLAGAPEALGPFSFGWTLPVALVVSVALTAGLALAVDALLFGPLRQRGSAMIIMVMSSFGAALALRNMLEFIFTSSPRYFSQELQIAVKFGAGMRATPDQLLVVAVALVLVAALHLLLTRTAVGRAMRAVAENRELAGLAGIDVRRVIRTAWILGAGLASVAGVMSGLVIQIRPEMGLDLLLPLFAAAILGGIGSVPGAMLAGLIVGLAESATVALIGAEWRAAVAFVILVAILLIRPRGLFGRPE